METLFGPTYRGLASRSPDLIEVRDPQNGGLIGTVPRATLDDVANSIARAKHGADIAREMPTHTRIAILQRAADLVTAESRAYAELIAREGIKTIREATQEVCRCVDTLRLSAEEARRLTGETIRFDQRPGSEQRVGYWFREPLGIVVACTPFNDPLNLVAHKVGPAIASGNSIIVKPHSATPLSAVKLASAFVAADLPTGVLQVLTGLGSEIGTALTTHPDVAMVTFTGGQRVGLEIARAAAGKRLVLELGANSPVIVLPDADLKCAAAAITAGAFSAAGQNCLHVQRVIAHRQVRKEIEERLVETARQLRTGDKLDEATDMGPLIDESNAIRVSTVIEDAVHRGGKLLIGGRRRGTFLDPTIIGDLPRASILAQTEVFGPVTGLMEVDSLTEGIALANAVDYGLQASIFTRDLAAAMRAVRELRAGTVLVNDSTDYRIDAMPFGGNKASGLGREGVSFAIQEMTTPKVVCFNL